MSRSAWGIAELFIAVAWNIFNTGNHAWAVDPGLLSMSVMFVEEPEWLALIPLIDNERDKFPSKSVGANNWQVKEGVLKYHQDGKSGKIILPAKLEGDVFELEVAFSLSEKNLGFNVDVPGAEGFVPFFFLPNGDLKYGSRIIGKYQATEGQPATIMIQWGKAKDERFVECFQKGKSICRWQGDDTSMRSRIAYTDIWKTSVTLYSYASDITFHQLRVRAISGKVSADTIREKIKGPLFATDATPKNDVRPGLSEANRKEAQRLLKEGAGFAAKGNYREACEATAKAVQIYGTNGNSSPEYVATASVLAGYYESAGDYDAAKKTLESALAAARQTMQEKDPWLIRLQQVQMDLLMRRGEYRAAEEIGKKLIEIRKAVEGPESLEYADVASTLAAIYFRQAKYSQSERLQTEVCEIWAAKLGVAHPRYATALNNLGVFYIQTKQYTKGEDFLRDAIGTLKAAKSDKSEGYVRISANLGSCYAHLNQNEKAEQTFQETLAIAKKHLGEKDIATALALRTAGTFHCNQRYFKKAEAEIQEAVEISKTLLGDKSIDYAESITDLGMLYRVTDRATQAIDLYRHALVLYAKEFGTEHPHTKDARNRLLEIYGARGQKAEADQIRKEFGNP